MGKNKSIILGIIVMGALIAGWFYINGSDQATKQAGATYFFGALLVLAGYYILFKSKR